MIPTGQRYPQHSPRHPAPPGAAYLQQGFEVWKQHFPAGSKKLEQNCSSRLGRRTAICCICSVTPTQVTAHGAGVNLRQSCNALLCVLNGLSLGSLGKVRAVNWPRCFLLQPRVKEKAADSRLRYKATSAGIWAAFCTGLFAEQSDSRQTRANAPVLPLPTKTVHVQQSCCTINSLASLLHCNFLM